MERTRKFLAIAVVSGFALIAAMPFIGIRPADFIGYPATETTVEVSPVSFRGSILAMDDPELAKAAVYALSNSLTDETISLMFPLMDEALPLEVRKAVLYAVANHEGDDVLAFLRRVATEDNEVELQKAAVYAIGNTDHADAVRALVEVMGSDADADVRKAAVYALGNQDSDAAREALMGMIGNLK